MAAKKSPATHRILALSSDSSPNKFASIESQLNALAAEGWTIHITQIEVTLSCVTVFGWATK